MTALVVALIVVAAGVLAVLGLVLGLVLLRRARPGAHSRAGEDDPLTAATVPNLAELAAAVERPGRHRARGRLVPVWTSRGVRLRREPEDNAEIEDP